MELLCSLLFAVALEPLQVSTEVASEIDTEATVQGVHVRVGRVANDWVARVTAIDREAQTATVELQPPGDEASFRREVPLHAAEPDAQGRELAAGLAVIFENYTPPSPDRSPAAEVEVDAKPVEAAPPSFNRTGFVAVGGSLSLGPHTAPAIAGLVGIQVGGWVAGAHVQPRLRLGWVGARPRGVDLDGVALEAGVAFGGELAQGSLWLGAGPFGEAVWVRAKGSQSASTWAGQLQVPVIATVRLPRRISLGFEVGPTLQFPPLRFVTDTAQVRWRTVRLRAGISIGFVFG